LNFIDGVGLSYDQDFSGHVRYSLYEVITSKKHWRALLLSHWPSSSSLVLNFLNASSGGQYHLSSWPFDTNI